MTELSPWLRRRIFLDRMFAAVAGLIAAPLVGLLALLVRRHDGGPGLISVPRVGRDNRPFAMWKVRTMRSDDAGGRAAGSSLTSFEDDRITPIGRRLRAFHLDELPQLYNVVRGEMTLLGPRPEAPEFVDASQSEWRAVLSVPPGIAGPTQVIVNDWERELISSDVDGTAYRTQVLPAKLAIDHWYLRRSSARIDALVMITLGRRFLPGTGSWTLKQRVSAEVPEARDAIEWGRGASAARVTTTQGSAESGPWSPNNEHQSRRRNPAARHRRIGVERPQ